MTYRSFVKLVTKMRKAQKAFFVAKTGSPEKYEALRAAMPTEKDVDTALECQANLFTEPDLPVLDICVAYESGYGKGVIGHLDINPYPDDSPGFQAYEYGVRQGVERREKAAGASLTYKHEAGYGAELVKEGVRC